jgi:hypothetical protein
MSALGHSRQTETLPTLAACPLLPESRQVADRLDMSALCQQRTHAPQQMTCSNCNDLLNHCDGEQLITRPVYTPI